MRACIRVCCQQGLNPKAIPGRSSASPSTPWLCAESLCVQKSPEKPERRPGEQLTCVPERGKLSKGTQSVAELKPESGLFASQAWGWTWGPLLSSAPLRVRLPLIWGQTEIKSGVNGPEGPKTLCRAGSIQVDHHLWASKMVYGALTVCSLLSSTYSISQQSCEARSSPTSQRAKPRSRALWVTCAGSHDGAGAKGGQADCNVQVLPLPPDSSLSGDNHQRRCYCSVLGPAPSSSVRSLT